MTYLQGNYSYRRAEDEEAGFNVDRLLVLITRPASVSTTRMTRAVSTAWKEGHCEAALQPISDVPA